MTNSKNESVQIPPFVLQCGRCKSIVGDSSSFIYFNNDQNNSVDFDSTANVKRLPDISTSKLGSESVTFHILQCNICGKTIGKYYLSAPSHMEYMLNKYSFSINEILYYQIGQSLVQGRQRPSNIDFFKNASRYIMSNNNNNITSTAGLDLNSIQDTGTYNNSSNSSTGSTTVLLTVNEEIDKIQYVLMNIVARLNALESNSQSHTHNDIDSNDHNNNSDDNYYSYNDNNHNYADIHHNSSSSTDDETKATTLPEFSDNSDNHHNFSINVNHNTATSDSIIETAVHRNDTDSNLSKRTKIS